MLPDLVRMHLHRGMHEQEVFDLLGRPDRSTWNDTYPYPGWAVGPAPTESLGLEASDILALIIEFDQAGGLRRMYLPYWETEQWSDCSPMQ
jgi:hypothetical protein